MPIIELIGIVAVASVAGAAGFYAARFIFRRKNRTRRPKTRVSCTSVTQRVSSVGRFVALEVTAKEIATAATGPEWIPPALLTRAKVAMIFHFQHQYVIDLTELAPDDITVSRSGTVRLRPPPIQSRTVLVDLEPYDIQSGKMFGLIDVIPMGAVRQRKLMNAAKEQAGVISEEDEQSHLMLARTSAEKQVRRMLANVGITIEFDWSRGLAEQRETVGVIEPETADAETDERTRETIASGLKPVRVLKPVVAALAS